MIFLELFEQLKTLKKESAVYFVDAFHGQVCK